LPRDALLRYLPRVRSGDMHVYVYACRQRLCLFTLRFAARFDYLYVFVDAYFMICRRLIRWRWRHLMPRSSSPVHDDY